MICIATVLLLALALAGTSVQAAPAPNLLRGRNVTTMRAESCADCPVEAYCEYGVTDGPVSCVYYSDGQPGLYRRYTSSDPVPCGALGEACCTGTTKCSSETAACYEGLCATCGGESEPCCTSGDACTFGLDCLAGNLCRACGNDGQACCTGNRCNPGSQCASFVCVACGAEDQSCCPGDVCDGQLTCDMGACISPS